jgi:hypothetical protein
MTNNDTGKPGYSSDEWLKRVLKPPPPFMGPDTWVERGQIVRIALHDEDLEFRSLACWEIQRRQHRGRPFLRFHDGSGQRAQEARNWTLSSALQWHNDAMKGLPRERV